jgi:hypothetical protein
MGSYGSQSVASISALHGTEEAMPKVEPEALVMVELPLSLVQRWANFTKDQIVYLNPNDVVMTAFRKAIDWESTNGQ